MTPALQPILLPVAGGVVALNCRHFRGDRPCALGYPGLCEAACSGFAPLGARVLVIKLGALGDVIRTAAILPGLHDALGACHITWVTRPEGVRMLANHPQIDRLLPFGAETLAHLELEQFDLCVSLDKEPAPAGLAMRVRAHERRGIGLSSFGTPVPLNPECESYFRLGLDDEMKFRGNPLSYAELIYQAIGLPYRGQRYTLYPDQRARRAADAACARAGVARDKTLVGLNTGSGGVFANKNWPPEKFLRLARALRQRPDICVGLLGGPRERALNHELAARAGVIDLGSDHDELTFAALVARCGVVLTGDTLALHVAVAMGVPVVALFGPTCPQEIDLFGRGQKLVTPLECSPCYRRACDKSPNCMDTIGLERVLRAMHAWLPQTSDTPGALYAPTTAPTSLALPILEIAR